MVRSLSTSSTGNRSLGSVGVGIGAGVALVLALSSCRLASHPERAVVGSIGLGAVPPQEWADMMVAIADGAAEVGLDEIASQLKSPSALDRSRAALALGAAGPAAVPYLAALLDALRDPVANVRSEAAFAIGNSRQRSAEVLGGLFRALMTERDPLVKRRLSAALDHMAMRPRIAISPRASAELQQALAAASDDRLPILVRVAARADVPWAAPAFVRLLRHSSPDIRLESAWALAAIGDTSATVVGALGGLAADTVKWVRDDLPTILQRLTKWREDAASCGHRMIGGLIPAEFSVEQTSLSLRPDQYGVYAESRDRVSSSHSYAFNLLLPAAMNPSVPTTGARRQTQLSHRTRTLHFDLSRAIPGIATTPLGVISDSAAEFHTFFHRDRKRLIWNTRDIPVGARVVSSRTEFVIHRGGRTYHLQFGPWAVGDCQESYAPAGSINGNGTSAVMITRWSESEYQVTTPPQALGRLWEVLARDAAKDLGLYHFEFSVRLLAAQP